MAGMIEAKLRDLGIVLPAPAKPLANYVPFVRAGDLVFISGQLPAAEGKIAVVGKLGEAVTIEQGQLGARLCFINIMAHMQSACDGDLDRVQQVVRLGGFIAAPAGFTAHAQVMNGASDLAVAVFGERGRHARAAVGVPSLPGDAAVEVDAVIRIA
jgi:enamine deaminase RidA (YjgF/YER057c/UK114 family)